MLKKYLRYLFLLVFLISCSENEKKVINENIKCVEVVDTSNKAVKNALVHYSSVAVIMEEFDSTGGKIADKQDGYFLKKTDIYGRICIKEYPIVKESVIYTQKTWTFSKNNNSNKYYFKDIPKIIILNNVDTTFKYKKVEKELDIKLKIEDF